MADFKFKLREAIGKTFSLSTGQKHKFQLILPQVFVLDVEDSHFNHNRSILLPDLTSTDKSTPILDARRVTGLGVIFAAIEHAKKNPSQGLFVTGHTDASGGAAYNQTLSEERAKNVSLLLRGKRDDWRKQAAKDDAVDDYQTILKWQHQRAGWDTDPGPINNKLNAQTKAAIGEFQRRYTEEVANAKAGSALFGRKALVEPGQKPDRVVGKDTWGAFYDLYMDDLMDLLDLTDVAQLEALQAKFKPPPGMTDFVGCGEHIPHNPERRDPFAKQSDELDGPQKNPPDRRVEILFFDPGEEVDLVCHPKPGKCVPAECPVYTKGPHQQVPIGIPKGLNVAEVNLKLTFVDPEGKIRTFPEGLEVEAKFGEPVNETTVGEDGLLKGDTGAAESDDPDADAAPAVEGADPDAESMEVDQEPNEKVGPGGLLRFVIPRKASKLFLRILAGDDKRFVTADRNDLTAQELATLPDAFKAVGNGRVFFQLPTVFNTRQGYFKGPDGVDFKDGQFLNIDNRETQIGSREAPAELRLEIHWQHFKFEYFDRFTSSMTTVSQPRTKAADGGDVPALVLQGFPFLPDPPSDPTFPLARSAWDVKVGKDTVHCLAWVRRDIPESGPVRELPDDKSMSSFKTGNLFVRTEGDGKSPDADRKFVVHNPGDPAVSTPGVDRLRLYDLPNDWWSTNYPVRLADEGTDKVRPFQKAVIIKSKTDKPYVVSLDTIVLDDADVADIKNPTIKDDKVENRIAIYDNLLQVYKPDPDEIYFTKVKDLVPQPSSPILLDFPKFTRLISRGRVVYDVFADRTGRNTDDFKGFPIGARLAKRLTDANANAGAGKHHICDTPYNGVDPDGTPDAFPAGTVALLRCCGHVDNLELFRLFQYMSVNFDFKPTATPPKETVLTKPPVGAEAETEAKNCLLKVAERWNDPSAVIHVGAPETARGRWMFLLTRGAKSSTPAPQHPEVRINIFGKRRASQGGSQGNWEFNDMSVGTEDNLTAAHELGHALSLPDEYLNTDDEPSLGQPNVLEEFRSLGTPYGLDPSGMMGGAEKLVRTRSLWHTVLWARERGYFADAKSITIDHGPNKFTADLTPRTQNRAERPVLQALNCTKPGSRMFCDQFVYVTGQDGWTAGELGGSKPTPFDGFVMVRVKMAWAFASTSSFGTMRERAERAFTVIGQAFNVDKRLVARGTFGGRAVRLRVLFAPRFVGVKFPEGDGADVYLKSIDRPTLASLNADPKLAFPQRVKMNTDVGMHANVILGGSGSPGVVNDGNTPRQAVVRNNSFFSFITGSEFDDDVARVFAQLVGLNNEDFRSAEEYRPLMDTLSGLGKITLEFVP